MQADDPAGNRKKPADYPFLWLIQIADKLPDKPIIDIVIPVGGKIGIQFCLFAGKRLPDRFLL